MCLQVCHLLMNENVKEFILYTNRISYGIAMMCWYWFSSNTNLLSKVIGGLHFADFIGSLLVSLKQNDEHDSIRNTPCPALLTWQIWKYNQDNQNNYALQFPSTSQLKEKEKAQFWQGKSEEFDCRDQLCNLAQIGSKSIFQPEWAWNLTDGIVKQQWTSSIALATICVSFYSHPWIQTGVVIRKLKSDPHHPFVLPLWPSNWTDDLENNSEPPLCHFRLVHHFIAISEFNLDLQSRTAQFGSKSSIL